MTWLCVVVSGFATFEVFRLLCEFSTYYRADDPSSELVTAKLMVAKVEPELK